jgi:flagellar biogenesis protein FliO
MAKNHRWLFLPPAVALLLVLGPLSMTAGGKESMTSGGKDEAARKPPAAAAAPADRPALPRTPDLWQIGSTLCGVLLLGGALVFVVRRAQRGPSPAGSQLIALRQTVRVSPKQAVHAVEFDGRLLLLGEGERGLQLLHAGALPDQAADEAAVAGRAAVIDDDDGAVPKNLVLPRPAARAPASAPAGLPARRPAAAAPHNAAPRPRTLGDFRTLLAKVGR